MLEDILQFVSFGLFGEVVVDVADHCSTKSVTQLDFLQPLKGLLQQQWLALFAGVGLQPLVL